MTGQAFSFIHAANLMLDGQLRGVGVIPESARHILEDATQASWQRVVAAAVEHQVAFVLLSGNTFDAADHSLTSHVALREGLEQLAEHKIPVVITPGGLDPDAAWRLSPPLPGNVTRFGGESGRPVTIYRNGTPLAKIHHVMAHVGDLNGDDANGLEELVIFAPEIPASDASLFHVAMLDRVLDEGALAPELAAEQLANASENPFSGISPDLVNGCGVDYWAVGLESIRQSWKVGQGIAHAPGGTQPLTSRQTGPGGCSLVEVDADGQMHLDFLPTSRVRWEELTLVVEEHHTRDEILDAIRHEARKISLGTADELWLLSWRILGQGHWRTILWELTAARRMITEALQALAVPGVTAWVREVSLGATLASDLPEDFLTQEFSRHLGDLVRDPRFSTKLLEKSPQHQGPWEKRIADGLAEVDFQRVIPMAQQLGWTWLGANESPKTPAREVA